MKLPSVQQILKNTVRTFLRFPFVLINSFICTFAVVILIDHEGPSQPTVLFKILMATLLGIPFLTGLSLLTEKRRWAKEYTAGLQIIGILLLIGYGCSVPYDLGEAPAIHILRLLIRGLTIFAVELPIMGYLNQFYMMHKSMISY